MTAFLSEPFSRPYQSYRIANVVSTIDFETDMNVPLQAVHEITRVAGTIIAARFASPWGEGIPFPPARPTELLQWRGDIGTSHETLTELENGKFFGKFENMNVLEGIGKRAIWQRVVDETNVAFAVSLRKIDVNIGSRSEEALDDLVYEICLKEKLYLSNGWPDFRGIVSQIRLLEQQVSGSA
ncbi:hypothetical protein [Bradyrhizobium sp. S3.5.5]|uniref:hypothetical protein n=1 Tax=Bradyrhizobium sp. S3.5.5 TaxID=3156430 RepID=UPI003395AF31